MTALVILTVVLYSCFDIVQGRRWISATCELYDPMGKNDVRGRIRLFQKLNTPLVQVSGKIYGLSRGLHGFHVHRDGSFGNNCSNAGPHFNPRNQPHGAPSDEIRHAGDLGNVKADSWGRADVIKYDNQLRLEGPLTIIERAIVIHADPDDLGRGGNAESTRTGNAGGRLACCRIRRTHNYWY